MVHYACLWLCRCDGVTILGFICRSNSIVGHDPLLHHAISVIRNLLALPSVALPSHDWALLSDLGSQGPFEVRLTHLMAQCEDAGRLGHQRHQTRALRCLVWFLFVLGFLRDFDGVRWTVLGRGFDICPVYPLDMAAQSLFQFLLSQLVSNFRAEVMHLSGHLLQPLLLLELGYLLFCLDMLLHNRFERDFVRIEICLDQCKLD